MMRNRKNILITLVAIAKTSDKPIFVWQSEDIITAEGAYKGQREVYAQYMSPLERKALVKAYRGQGRDIKRLTDLLGETFKAYKTGLHSVGYWSYDAAIKMTCPSQCLPAWIYTKAIEPIHVVSGWTVDPLQLYRYYSQKIITDLSANPERLLSFAKTLNPSTK